MHLQLRIKELQMQNQNKFYRFYSLESFVHIHNLFFYNKLMEDIRKALDEDRFEEFKNEKTVKYGRRI